MRDLNEQRKISVGAFFKMKDEDLGGYLFKDGKRIDFEIIKANKINHSRETGCLRIRTTKNEINVDFLEEIKPTNEQLKTIEKLKSNKKLFFEIIDKNNNPIKNFGGFDKTIKEMKEQLEKFYNNPITSSQ